MRPFGSPKELEHRRQATSGMFGGLDDRIIEAIAISPEFLPEES